MTTQTTLGDTHRILEQQDGHRCQIVSKQIVGKMTILFDPGNLRIRVERPDEPALELRLTGLALERALLFDGQLASVRYYETWFDELVVDRTVSIVNRGTPFNGKQFAEALGNLFDSEDEKVEWLEQVDHFWPHFEDE